MSMKVYVEGGGDRRELKAKCRQGFSTFLSKTELAGQMPRVTACGSRQNTYDAFCTALAHSTDEDFIVLLVDSEDPVMNDPWRHLEERDRWSKPAGATDDNAHLMVQCMEAWFLADKDALADFFGAEFNRNALPQRLEVEKIPKLDLERGLEAATRQCRKGTYHKGNHSFEILAQLDPGKVIDASPHAERLVSTLLSKASGR